MRRHILGCFSLVLLAGSGCQWDELQSGNSFFGPMKQAKVPPSGKLPQSSVDVASRVDALGGQILAANPDVTIRPIFVAIGVPPLTVFHRGTTEIYVSDGVVQKCKTDGELAAVLCMEWAKMISDAQGGGLGRPLDRDPPLAPASFNDVVGGGSGPDRTNVAERALWEKNNPRRINNNDSRVNSPNALAQGYLTNAGYKVDDLVRVEPLLRQAAANPDYEKQLAPRR